MSSLFKDLEEFVGSSPECRTMAELDGAFARFVEASGFRHFSAVHVNAPRTESDDVVYIGRPNPTWGARYLEMNYARNDAAIRHLRTSDAPIWWNEFAGRGELERDELRLFGEAKECGIAEGISTAVRLADGPLLMCALTGMEAEPRWDLAPVFRFAAMHYVMVANTLSRPGAKRGRDLFTPCQRRILSLAEEGNTLQQVAEILGKSPSTIYNQIAHAKERTGARTLSELQRLLELERAGQNIPDLKHLKNVRRG